MLASNMRISKRCGTHADSDWATVNSLRPFFEVLGIARVCLEGFFEIFTFDVKLENSRQSPIVMSHCVRDVASALGFHTRPYTTADTTCRSDLTPEAKDIAPIELNTPITIARLDLLRPGLSSCSSAAILVYEVNVPFFILSQRRL
jgi:hypothetical protein